MERTRKRVPRIENRIIACYYYVVIAWYDSHLTEISAMHRLLRTAHFIGLALFFGSALSHIVEAIAGGDPGGAGFLGARQTIELATRVLTLPGLALTIASGLGLAALSRSRRAWMVAHGGLGLLVAILAFAVLVPAGREALAGAEALALGQSLPVSAGAALMTERIAGAFSIALTLAIIALGVYKPRIGWFFRRIGATANADRV